MTRLHVGHFMMSCTKYVADSIDVCAHPCCVQNLRVDTCSSLSIYTHIYMPACTARLRVVLHKFVLACWFALVCVGGACEQLSFVCARVSLCPTDLCANGSLCPTGLCVQRFSVSNGPLCPTGSVSNARCCKLTNVSQSRTTRTTKTAHKHHHHHHNEKKKNRPLLGLLMHRGDHVHRSRRRMPSLRIRDLSHRFRRSVKVSPTRRGRSARIDGDGCIGVEGWGVTHGGRDHH